MVTSPASTSSLVALTEENPEHVGGECAVVVGNHIRQEAAQRSGVLSGVGNAQGLAELPARISSEDFRLWQTACLVDCEPTVSQLATIVKVRLNSLGAAACICRAS